MAALSSVQRVLTQGLKALVEYVPVLTGGSGNAYNIPALGPTALVNIWTSSGTVSARNADGSTTGKQADGFVLSAVASGGQATVYLSGLDTAVTGLTAGLAYLSATTAGGVSTTGATTAGQTYQQVGVVTATGVLQFSPQVPVQRS